MLRRTFFTVLLLGKQYESGSHHTGVKKSISFGCGVEKGCFVNQQLEAVKD